MVLKQCLVLWSLTAWCAHGLQIDLHETEERLDPLLENHVFKHLPQRPSEYQVLRGGVHQLLSQPSRNARSVGDEEKEQGRAEAYHPGIVSIAVPVKGTVLRLLLNRVDIADPDLTLEILDERGEDVQEEHRVSKNCFYSGGSDDQWVVISTCSGVNGVIRHGESAYQLEQLSADDQNAVRRRRDASDPLFITYPLKMGNDFEPRGLSPTPSSGIERPVAELESVAVEQEVVVGGGEGGGRFRRRTLHKGPYTVELAVFIDPVLYSYIKKRFPGSNQQSKAVEIVMTLVNAVHRLYSDSSLGSNKVGMMVKKIKVLPTGKPSHNKGDIYKYLKNFCKWQSGKNPRGEKGEWDHAILLSGHDLWSDKPSRNSTVGLAYVGGMCTSSFSCTVNEGTTFAAAFIIAHEMGHNFNMKHDGSQEASKCKGNKNIMAPVMSSGATSWSSCSKSSLQSFLRSRGDCLTKSSTSAKKAGSKSHEGELPGKRFDADQQCRYMYGKGWKHFDNNEQPFNNVCQEIWCRSGRLLKTPSASALEGTPCGKSKICLKNECKPNTGHKTNPPRDVKTPSSPDDDNSSRNDHPNSIWNVIGVGDNDPGANDPGANDGPDATCVSKEDDCDNYTSFLGGFFSGGNFIGGVFNKILKALGACEDKCRRR